MSFPANPYLGQIVYNSYGRWRFTGQVWVQVSRTGGPVKVRTTDHPKPQPPCEPEPEPEETRLECELRHLRNRVVELEEILSRSFLLID